VARILPATGGSVEMTNNQSDTDSQPRRQNQTTVYTQNSN